jgi:hypothetical protein
MLAFADRYTSAHAGDVFEIETVCMFCLAMRREVFETLGPLDERYEIGLLEDDDYSARARAQDLRIVCAEDIFTHHFGQATFSELLVDGRYPDLLSANRRRFEEKWGYPPPAYVKRSGPAYGRLIQRVRSAVEHTAPTGATVLVVSKGSNELIQFKDRAGKHFPSDMDGTYAGHHPADSAEAVSLLEPHRRLHAVHLVFPATAFWWLEHYAAFAEHLDRVGRVVFRDDNCVIYGVEPA